MTDKEILQASLLDILFDNRNKDYGAYVLRRDYRQRLLIALVSALGIASLFLSLNFYHKKDSVSPGSIVNKDSVIIHSYIIPVDKPKEPERQKELSKSVQKTAQVKFTSNIIIKDDNKLKETDVPDVTELSEKNISNKNNIGIPSNGIENINNEGKDENNGTVTNENGKFIPVEREPEFPGGQEALIRFLKNNLNTPEDLSEGEKKTVKAIFIVGTDGMISGVDIVQSGGNIFDKEVIRVCKKMPRWKPALQNGSGVAVSYVLPVTFIGVEQ